MDIVHKSFIHGSKHDNSAGFGYTYMSMGHKHARARIYVHRVSVSPAMYTGMVKAVMTGRSAQTRRCPKEREKKEIERMQKVVS